MMSMIPRSPGLVRLAGKRDHRILHHSSYALWPFWLKAQALAQVHLFLKTRLHPLTPPTAFSLAVFFTGLSASLLGGGP